MKKFLIVAALALAGCSGFHSDQPFHVGDLVRLKINGQKAQVVYVNSCDGDIPLAECTYDIRMAVSQTFTDTHMIEPDGPLEARSIARVNYIRGFEMEKL